MPKEQTHWILAEKAAQRLPNGSLKTIINKCPNLYYIGAVIPDTPMYALHKTGQYGELAETLHGKSGENTFAPLANLAAEYEGRWTDAMWAFLLGAMAHILADAVYHPWVEYFTGSSTDVPEDKRLLSLARHRALESYLDLYHMRSFPGYKRKYFFSLLRKKEIQADAFDAMLNTLYFNSNPHDPGIRKALNAHGAIQWMFMQKGLAKIAFNVNALMKKRGSAWVTLFYPDLEPPNPKYFGRGINYRHTVTGREKQGAVKDLEMKAVSYIAGMFELIEKYMEKGSVLDFLFRIKGPSLETGLVGAPSSAIVHYDLDVSLDEILGEKRIRT